MAKMGPAQRSEPRRPAVTLRGVSKKVISKGTRRPIVAMQLRSDTSQPWRCGNPECTNFTHTSLPRHETGRKAVSDYFGRNKKSTRDIPDDVWNWLCRICYQQGRYNATARTGAQPQDQAVWALALLRDQVQRFKIWRPEAGFTIQLQAGAEERYREYCVALERLGGDRAAAEESVTTSDQRGKRKGQLVRDRRQTLSMSHAKYIKEIFAGENKSYSDIQRVVDWMQVEVDRGELCHLAPIEFIIQDKREDEPFTDPQENTARFLAQYHGDSSPTDVHGKTELLDSVPSAGNQSDSVKVEVPQDTPVTMESKASIGKFRPLTDYHTEKDPLANIPMYQPPPPIRSASRTDGVTGVASAGIVSGQTTFASGAQPRTKQEGGGIVSTLFHILNVQP